MRGSGDVGGRGPSGDCTREKASSFFSFCFLRRVFPLFLRAWREPCCGGRRNEPSPGGTDGGSERTRCRARSTTEKKNVIIKNGSAKVTGDPDKSNVGAASPRAKLQQHRDRLELRVGDFLRKLFAVVGWLDSGRERPWGGVGRRERGREERISGPGK
jgi:hypothetical protein